MLGRSKNIDALYRILSEIVFERTTAEWLLLLREAGIPHTSLLGLEDILADSHGIM